MCVAWHLYTIKKIFVLYQNTQKLHLHVQSLCKKLALMILAYSSKQFILASFRVFKFSSSDWVMQWWQKRHWHIAWCLNVWKIERDKAQEPFGKKWYCTFYLPFSNLCGAKTKSYISWRCEKCSFIYAQCIETASITLKTISESRYEIYKGKCMLQLRTI